MFHRITLVALLVLTAMMVSGAQADVNVNVNIGLPAVQISEEPVLAVIPGTYVYFIYGNQHDFFFYGGYWWRLHQNRWYRAGHFNGPWKLRKGRSVPAQLLRLPPNWRQMDVVHSGFRYQEVKKNWKQWEKEKRWEKKDGAQGDKGQKMKDKPSQDKNGKEKPGKGGKGRK
jgi:hypothetical protein